LNGLKDSGWDMRTIKMIKVCMIVTCLKDWFAKVFESLVCKSWLTWTRDHWMTWKLMTVETHISCGIMYEILVEYLGRRWICMKFVPCSLVDEFVLPQ
jgi:hypothetical protein